MSYFYRIILLSIIILGTETISAQPVNDECGNAFLLSDLNNWCSAAGAYTNLAATASPEASPFCFPLTQSHDVWVCFCCASYNG